MAATPHCKRKYCDSCHTYLSSYDPPGKSCRWCVLTPGKHPTGSANAVPPEVDPTREARIHYYQAKASCNQPLFDEARYDADQGLEDDAATHRGRLRAKQADSDVMIEDDD